MSEKFDINLTNAEPMYDYIKGKNRETKIAYDGEVYAGKYSRKIMNYDSNHFSLGISTTGGINKPTRYEIDATNLLHTALFGGTGSGKSTIMRNVMVQFAQQGYGFTFIDPKEGKHPDIGDDFPVTIGEDTHKLLRELPEHRLKDIVYINPIQTGGYSVSVNPLKLPDYVKDGSSEQYEQEDIIEAKMELLKQIMMSEGDDGGEEGSFGAIMERAYEGVFQPMIRSDIDFNFADLHYILNNEDAMKKFAQRMSEELGDEFQVDETKQVAELNKGELDSLIRRTQRIVTSNRNARDFIVNDVNDIDFKEMVENNKIIIVDIQSKSQSVINTAIGYTVSSLYTASAKANAEGDKNEHILFGDEFHKFVSLKKAIHLSDILSEGRSQNFLLWYATQNPNRIKEFVTESLTNLGLAITGTISAHDAGSITSLFTDRDGNEIDKKEINNMDRFTYYVCKTNDSAPYQPVKGYPPYPPRRSLREAALVAGESVRRYGSQHKRRLTFKSAVKPFLLGVDVELSKKDGLRAIYTAQKFDAYNKDKDMKGFATTDTINKVIESSYDIKSDFRFDVWVERQMNIENVRASDVGGEICYHVTNEGKDVMSMDTGKSGSAGGDGHRAIAQNLKHDLAKYGIHVDLPEQGGSDDKPDAFGYIFEKTDETPFVDSYDIGERITIEAEKETTSSKPSKMLKNFTKTDDDVLFISTYENIVENIEQKLTDGGGLAKETEHGRKAYNKDDKLKEGESYPLRKLHLPDDTSAGWTRWFVDDTDTLKLMEKTADGLVTTVTYNPSKSFENWSVRDFEAHAEKTSKGYVIHDHETEETHTGFRSIDDINDETIYNTVVEPYVPDVELENAPERDEYNLILVPDNCNSYDDIMIYYDGEYHTISEYKELDKDMFVGDNKTDNSEIINTPDDKDKSNNNNNNIDEEDFDFF